MKRVIIALIFILCLANVMAIGVSPGKKEIIFEPGKEITQQITIYNNDKKDFKALIDVEGELAEHIEFSEVIIPISKGEESRPITYSLKLPEKIEKPGTHTLRIKVTEIPDEKESRFIGTRASVISKLEIRVPYPGKYAEAQLRVEDNAAYVIVNNLGQESIDTAQARINIYGPSNELIETIESTLVQIDSKKRKELVLKWTKELNPGIYYARGVVEYDKNIINIEMPFQHGEPTIMIRSIQASKFILGQIAQFDVDLLNTWPEVVKDITTSVLLRQGEQEFGRFNANPIDLPPLKEESVPTYINTEGLDQGSYSLDVEVKKDAQVFNRTFDIKMSMDKISIETGNVVVDPGTGSILDRKISILFIFVGLLFVLNIFLFFKLKKRKET